MNRLSLKLKVTLWYTLAMMIISAIAVFATVSFSRKILEKDMTERLSRTVEMSSRQVITPDGRLRSFPPFRFYEHGVHMALYDSGKTLIAGQEPFGITDSPDLSEKKLESFIYNGARYYCFDIPVRSSSGEMWLRGMTSLADENYMIESVSKTNILLSILLIIIAALGGYLIISRAFVPVNKISAAAREIIKSNDLSERINIGSGKDEISSLANTFDEMLEAIENAFEREKQFTSDASHELRTPVAVILAECEYMNDCAETVPEFKESAAAVTRQAEKMSKLISELLTISRMDKNTLQLNFEDVDISELLGFVCEEQKEIREENISLISDIPSDIHVEADRFQLARLFINLISNAYQYGKDGGYVKVELLDEGGTIRVSVSDNGIGISKENIPKIWERFFQADPSRTAKESGSMGLGLSMVKWICDCHNGNINVSSEPGKGSEFIFTMPKKRTIS